MASTAQMDETHSARNGDRAHFLQLSQRPPGGEAFERKRRMLRDRERLTIPADCVIAPVFALREDVAVRCQRLDKQDLITDATRQALRTADAVAGTRPSSAEGIELCPACANVTRARQVIR